MRWRVGVVVLAAVLAVLAWALARAAGTERFDVFAKLYAAVVPPTRCTELAAVGTVATRAQPRFRAAACSGQTRQGNDGQPWVSDGARWTRVRPVVAAADKAKALPEACKIWGDAFGSNATVAGGVARDNVRATYHYFSPEYATGTVACADKFWADPDHPKMLLKYPWTAYCLSKPFQQSTCGKCLRVTNRRTGAFVIARAVDNGGCSDADGTGLDLDTCAFNAIDTDGQGHADGNMRVDVREVAC